MFNFVLNNNETPIGQVEFVDPLNGFASAIVWPSGSCPAPALGTAATLTVGALEFAMVVDDFRLTGSGGWIKLVAPAARAVRYDAEVFSGKDETTFQKVIAARTPVNAPPELDRKLPAIVADCSLAELLGDICSRTPGWAWWTASAGLEIGPPAPATVQVDGAKIASSGNGFEVRLADLPPRAGTKVELPCGTSGVILQARVQWQSGSEPVFSAVLGAIPAGRRKPPRRTLRWPARVIQLDPLVMEATDEERTGRVFQTRARLMARRSDKQRFREDLPVQVDDVLEVAMPTGGVSILPLKVYVWSEATPASAYRVATHSAEVVVAEKAVASAKEIDESFNRRTSNVKDRWDVNKS